PEGKVGLAPAQLLGHSLMVLIDGLHVVAAGLDLSRSWRPVENPHEQLFNQLSVVTLGSHELRQLVRRISDRVSQRGTTHERHDRAQLQAARALAFAGTLTS